VDHSEKLHITYLDYTNETVKYATNTSGPWVTQAVGPASSSHWAPSIALDGSGGAHISYIGNDGLEHATNASGVWVTETVDSRGGSSSIAVDAAGKVHISYSGTVYATNVSGSWVTEVVDPAGGSGSSLALDGGDKAHICYRSNDYNLVYATNASGSWLTEIVDTSHGKIHSIALDSSDNAHIAYSGEDYVHKYATNASGAWMTQAVGSPEPRIRLDPSIALDGSDKVHMSYRSETCLFYPLCSNTFLMYATNASGRWESWVASQTFGYGDDNSIAVCDSGTIYISHHGAVDGTLLLTSGTPPPSSGWGLASTVESESRGASAAPNYLLLLAAPVGIILLRKALKGRRGLSR
jgi:hypothetical protein